MVEDDAELEMLMLNIPLDEPMDEQEVPVEVILSFQTFPRKANTLYCLSNLRVYFALQIIAICDYTYVSIGMR